jgi:hypothetical protein
MAKKDYFIKLHRPDGKYINTITDASFVGFRKQINGGLGELTFDLARKFDDFKEDEEIILNNKVEIWLSDIDTAPEGRLIYTGYISSYRPWIDGNQQGVEVRCLGYISKLDASIYKSGSTVEISHSSQDPSDIIKNIIDRYRAESICKDPFINYTAASIDDTGESESYVFNSANYKDALDKALELAPSGWWYYLNADNDLYFKPTKVTADHRFIFGKHFKKIEVVKNMEAVVNRVLFNSSEGEKRIFKLYQDNNSADEFGDRWECVEDGRVTIEATADDIGNAIIASKKEADVATIVEIFDNNEDENFGYDIESIEPGDTCEFLGFNDITSKTFEGVMLIKAVEYNLDYVRLELESLQEALARQADKNRRAIQEQINYDHPKSYPDVNVADMIGRKIVMFGSGITVLNLSNRPTTARTNLDLSSYISDKAKAVIVRVSIKDSNDPGSYILLYPDTADTSYDILVRGFEINWANWGSGICRCSTSQIIEYQIVNQGTSNDCDVTVELLGYIE